MIYPDQSSILWGDVPEDFKDKCDGIMDTKIHRSEPHLRILSGKSLNQRKTESLFPAQINLNNSGNNETYSP